MIIAPIVLSVHGLIVKSFDQHLKNLTLEDWINVLIQETVLLDSARIVRTFLDFFGDLTTGFLVPGRRTIVYYFCIYITVYLFNFLNVIKRIEDMVCD